MVSKQANEIEERIESRERDQRAGETGKGRAGKTKAAAAGKTADEAGAASHSQPSSPPRH